MFVHGRETAPPTIAAVLLLPADATTDAPLVAAAKRSARPKTAFRTAGVLTTTDGATRNGRESCSPTANDRSPNAAAFAGTSNGESASDHNSAHATASK